jgi:hypothetical protein
VDILSKQGEKVVPESIERLHLVALDLQNTMQAQLQQKQQQRGEQ